MRHVCLVMLLIASGVGGQEPRPIPRGNFEKIHTMIKQQPGEWKWAELPWSIQFAEAQRRAMLDGKPIFVVMAAQGSAVGCL